ncbi:AraC family transcriptional regulator [Streptomyces sp. FH025]|uniref:helix-turn-helix domain-containing protein n=1 Tax=Streptomyces sp. FH025 TaxID=2815937 RepID=UPI002434DE87|nr:AraC family transcriptional regulator [Streptomyces sp. FH025]
MTIGDGYALYRGPLADSAFHRHAAFQVAVAVCGPVVVTDAAGRRHGGAAVVVAPMARHRMDPVRQVRAFYVDPHCAFADRLRNDCGPGVSVAPRWRGLQERDLRPAGVLPSAGVDARLRAAMRALAEDRLPLERLAARVGLSPQRLRALARAQLGVPLTCWRAWRQLARAVDALGQGHSLAEAALAGGFADQAHLSRRMRELTGLTPSVVRPAVRAGGVRADRSQAPARAGRRAV